MVTAAALRIVFFGTPEFAVPTLEALLASRHEVVGVVTRQDRPRGRGQRTSDMPVKARAVQAGVPVLQPERMNDPAFLSALTALDADLGVVAAYGRLLTEAILAIPRRGLINVHASLLPRYRGAAPVHRAVINGDEETGITIMRVVRALDEGPMLAVARRPIGPSETSDDVERDLARQGAELLVSVVDALAAGPVAEVPQDPAGASYARRVAREDGAIDWKQPARAIHNLIRGLYPWPHAYTHLDGRRLILLKSHLPAGSAGSASPPGAGTILEAAGDRLLIGTGDGVLAVDALQAEGRRPMTTREFLSGSPLAVGATFTAAA